MSRLEQSIETLAKNPPPKRALKFLTPNTANAEIWRLQALLGDDETPFCFNLSRANTRIETLATRLADKGEEPVVAPAATAEHASHGLATDEPLNATAEQYLQLTLDEQATFGAANGLMLRSEFDRLTPAYKASFCRSQAKVVDEISRPVEQNAFLKHEDTITSVQSSRQGTISKSEFEKLSFTERNNFFKAGGKLTGETMMGRVLTRDEFAALDPQAKHEFCKSAGRII